MYRCISCGKDVELDLSTARKIQCPFCGYRILRKTRPPNLKRVKAE